MAEYTRTEFIINTVIKPNKDTERAEAYNKLLERVRKAGGYFAFDEKSRPLATTSDGETISVAALFEGTDDSSPLKVISSSFMCWDVDDYIMTADLERIL